MYCTLDDIRGAIPEYTVIQLVDDERLNPAAIDTANADHEPMIERIDEAILAATAEIEAYVGARYPVPLSPVPSVIVRITVDLAVYHLYSRHGERMPEVRAERRSAAAKLLARIGEGKADIGVRPTETARGTGSVTPAARRFTMNTDV